MADERIAECRSQLAALEAGLAGVCKRAEEPPKNDDTLESFQILNEVLSSTYDQTGKVLLKLEGLTGPSARREAILPLYLSAKTNLQKKMNAILDRDGEPSRNRQILDQTLCTTNTSRQDHLPRIDLPRYSGSPTEWLAFKTRFERRIATLTEDSTKYAFLSKCLEKFEPARNSCEAFENAGVPFDEAWTKLEERFYKKRLAFEGQFFTLLKLKKLQKPDPRGVLHIIDVVDTTLSTTSKIANANNEPAEIDMKAVANGLLMCLVKERLDETTRLKLEEKLDLQQIYTWREYKIELEKVGNQLTSRSISDHQPTKTSAKTATVAVAPKERHAPKCFLCDQKHTLDQCPESSAEKKFSKVQSLNKCFNCLHKGHSARECRSDHRCKVCGLKHHTILHREESSEKPQAAPAAPPAPAPSSSKQ